MIHPNKFTSLNTLKQTYPDAGPFYGQGWIYYGISCYFEQQGQFDHLCFTSEILDHVCADQQADRVDPRFYAFSNLYEANPGQWFPEMPRDALLLVSGCEQEITAGKCKFVGFDHWDIYLYQLWSMPLFYGQINRTGLTSAKYDVSIPTGRMDEERILLVDALGASLSGNSVITSLDTMFSGAVTIKSLGYDIYLNKVGIDDFDNTKVAYASWFDTNQGYSLEYFPYRDLYASARVSCIIETRQKFLNTAFTTEKTYKVLSQKRPFVLFGDNYILQHLRNKGFKTFGDYCDESYDIEINPEKKIAKLVEALKQLIEATKKDPDGIDAICKYNQDWFFNAARHFDSMAKFGKTYLEGIDFVKRLRY